MYMSFLKRKNGNGADEQSSWVFGDDSGDVTPQASAPRLAPRIQQEIIPNYQREEISNKISSSFVRGDNSESIDSELANKPNQWAFNVRWKGIVLVVFVALISSLIVGMFYTKKDSLVILSFQNLSNMRYVEFMEKEHIKKKKVLEKYNELKRNNNAIAIQKESSDIKGYLSNLYVLHRKEKTDDYVEFHKIGLQSLIDTIEMFDLLSSWSSLKNEEIKVKLTQKEKSVQDSMVILEEQIGLIKNDVFKKEK